MIGRRTFLIGSLSTSVAFSMKCSFADDDTASGLGETTYSSGNSSYALGLDYDSYFNQQVRQNYSLEVGGAFNNSSNPLLSTLAQTSNSPPPPTPTTGSYSMFDRHSDILRRWAEQDNGTGALQARLVELAKSCALFEQKAWDAHKQLGEWAQDVARGSYRQGQWKCNVFFAEMALKAGMEPMYTSGHAFADTRTMLASSSFTCWTRTDVPVAGDAGVYPFHVFIVENPKTGLGISALRKYVKETQHFSRDSEGRYFASEVLLRTEPHTPYSGPPKEVIFFHYSCPDLKSGTAQGSP